MKNIIYKRSLQGGTKGFTLIELLVVIAIIAVLSVVVILTLNPAELLKQARDSNRISNFGTLKTAISLWIADVSSTANNAMGAIGMLWVSYNPGGVSSSVVPYICGCANYTWGYASTTLQGGGVGFSTSSAPRSINGGGWVPINFSNISSGAPIGSEPIDPVNASPTVYTYVASTGTQFKMAANLESTKYSFGGGSDAESTDGGNSTSTFEGGSNPAL